MYISDRTAACGTAHSYLSPTLSTSPWIPFQKKREDAFFLAMMPLAGVIPQES